VISSSSTGKSVTLLENLNGSTQNKTILLATAGFGSIPGGVQPDFQVTPLPAGFFNPAGDTIKLEHHQLIDSRTFTSVPTDGVKSRVYPSDLVADTNSPVNFAGQAGLVNLSIFAGDYNDNGVVDGADYVVYRDNLGSTNEIPNDLTPHWVMEDDYPVWRSNFGALSGSGTTTSSVPEPACPLLAVVAFSWAAARTRRRQYRAACC
jgi:hypothetical protein